MRKMLSKEEVKHNKEEVKELVKRFENNMLPPREWLERYASMRKMKERSAEYIRNNI